MFRIFSYLWICVVSFTTFTLCKPADLENTCDVRSKSFFIASLVRYATGDRSSSCLPAFTFLDQWGVYNDSTASIASITSNGGHIIVGGNFTMVAVSTGSSSMVDPVTGTVVPNRFCPHLKVMGSTNAAISDGSGGFYIGGNFTHVQGVKQNQVAHILYGCQIDPNFITEEDPSRNITALQLLGDNLYVGGMFTGWGSGSQSNIASLNRYSGKLNSEFVTGTFDNTVFDIVTDGSALYVGGHFQNVGATPKRGLVKLYPNAGSIDTSFTGQAPIGGQVNDLHLGSDHSGTPVLYVVGPFTGRAMSFYLNGTQTTWAPNPNLEVYKVSQYENTIYLGGAFTTIGVTPANYLVGVDNQLGAIKENSFLINNVVQTLAIIGNKIYVLGEFTAAKGQERKYAASYDLPNMNLNIWDPNLNSAINFPAGEIVSTGSSILIASNHSAINTKHRKNFAVFEESTGSPIEGTPNFDFGIKSLHIKNNHLFVGGSFEHVNGIPRIALAILDLPTYQLNPTNLNVLPAGTETRTITSNDTQIFFGGAGMSSVNGQTRNAVASINAENYSLTNWNPNLGGSATSLLVLNDAVYIGGIYISLNGDNTISNYRAVDTNTGLVLPLPSISDYPNSDVSSQAHYDGKIYIGGIFSLIGASTFNNFAMYDTNTKSYITPNPIYANGFVYSITPSPDGKIVVAGAFSGLNGSTTNNCISAFDSKTNTILPWFPNADNTGYTSIYHNGKWYIGGEFKKVFNKPYGGLIISDLTEK
ncbi:NHL repeat-containing protein [Leptospira kanakyensis]|uniref:hypothetical protein n=1 Tax=Leptospira kanakyensis TaxID=2484968 RepID=UPI00223DDE78|nr:hypothetical protein [Leptospira kanakyensis]MCW7468400.1 hypothetical protein [Leptospira kanakyensis]